MAIVVGVSTITSADNDKDVYAVVTSQTIIRGLGGFGYKGSMKLTQYPNRPKEQPTFVEETRILPG